MASEITRKEFFQRCALLGLTVAAGGTVLAGCGGGEKSETASTKTASAGPCSDLTGLAEADVKMRENLKYVEVTTDQAKRCDNCKFWLPPEEGKECGGCQLVKGPITAGGGCASWFTQEETPAG